MPADKDNTEEMKTLRTIVLTALTLLLCSAAFGQDNNKHNRDWRDRMKAEKIAFLTDAMDLTSAEAEKFWPVYNKAEAEKKESWKQVMTAYIALEEGLEAGKDDKEISTLLERYINAQKTGDNIDAKYLAEYRKILPNKKIAKLFVGEESFRRMQIHRLNKNDNSKNDKK